MAEDIISAEVAPKAGQANRGALALEQLGFQVLHIGPTISVRGPRLLWETTFTVSFEAVTKRQMAEVEGSEITYQAALTEQLRIPPELQDMVADVMFVEPPELL